MLHYANFQSQKFRLVRALIGVHISSVHAGICTERPELRKVPALRKVEK
jgi:hypothetical protein